MQSIFRGLLRIPAASSPTRLFGLYVRPCPSVHSRAQLVIVIASCSMFLWTRPDFNHHGFLQLRFLLLKLQNLVVSGRHGFHHAHTLLFQYIPWRFGRFAHFHVRLAQSSTIECYEDCKRAATAARRRAFTELAQDLQSERKRRFL